MRAGFFLRSLARDTRGARGRLLIFVLCLAVGVAAVVAVAALADSLDAEVRREAKRLLGGDLAIVGSRPVPGPVRAAAERLAPSGLAQVRSLVTMAAVSRGEGVSSLLVELKAVESRYPLYGAVESTPSGPLADLLAGGGALVGPELLERFDAAVGDELKIGRTAVRIGGLLRGEPDRIVTPFTLGPRMLIGEAAFEAAGLETFGSRIDYRLLVRLPGNPGREAVESAAAEVRTALAGSPQHRVETYTDVSAALRDGLRRVEGFLGLVALLSLLVGGVGVAQSIRAFLESRTTAIAVLKTLGLRPREAVALYLGQCLLLALAGCLLGSVAGLGIHALAPRILGDLVPVGTVDLWQPLAVAQGFALGLGVTVLFALLPLTAVARVPPLRALRRGAEPLPLPPAVAAFVALVFASGIVGLAAHQAGSAVRGLAFAGGVTVTVAALAAAAAGLRRACGRLRLAGGPIWWRHGAALVARPGHRILAALVALGLGVLVVLTTVLVERHLTDSLEADVPQEAPTAFLVDIQPDQWEGVEEALLAAGAERLQSVPVVMARLTAIDGLSVRELAEPTGPSSDERWALTREQRLTYMRELPLDNEVVAGALWSRPEIDEVSLEVEFAGEMGVEVGSRLTFDVQGVPLDLEVTSLRSVNWRTFGINFFLVVEPGVLEEAPQSRLATAALPAGGEQAIQDRLAESYPNVTLVNVRELLDKVAGVMRRLAAAIRLLGGFTAAAGLAILFGVVAAEGVRRARDVALLKTMGMTRREVAAVFGVELALTGLVAGTIGAGAAAVLTWALITRVFELDSRFFPWIHASGLLVTVTVVVGAGLAASFPALRRRPAEVLRDERE